MTEKTKERRRLRDKEDGHRESLSERKIIKDKNKRKKSRERRKVREMEWNLK